MGETLQQVFAEIASNGRPYLPESLHLLERVNTIRRRVDAPLLTRIDPSSIQYHPTHAVVDGVRVHLGTDTLTTIYGPGTEVYDAVAPVFSVTPASVIEGKEAQTYVIKGALESGTVAFSCPHAQFRFAEVQLDFPFHEGLYVTRNGKTLKILKITAEKGQDARMEAVEVEPVDGVIPPSSLIAHQLGRLFGVVPREMSSQVSFHYDAHQQKAYVKYHSGDGSPSAQKYSLEEIVEILSDFSLWNTSG